MDRSKIGRASRKRNWNKTEWLTSEKNIKKKKYVWAKYNLEDRQYKEISKAFKEKLDEYLRLAREKPEQCQVWFWDECGFSSRVIIRRTWTKKGKRKKSEKPKNKRKS